LCVLASLTDRYARLSLAYSSRSLGFGEKLVKDWTNGRNDFSGSAGATLAAVIVAQDQKPELLGNWERHDLFERRGQRGMLKRKLPDVALRLA
jgi:hypothetical protein